jgi:hypothetical protein
MDTMELQHILKKLVYYAKISKMGDKKMVIIPKTFWDDIEDLEDEKQLKITIESVSGDENS